MEIQGYENYLIYTDGRVYNRKFNRFLKLRDTRGYKRVVLYNDNKSRSLQVHRLVAIHYISNPHNKPQVDHINRVKDDNRVENLRWVSPLENCQNKGKTIQNTTGYKNITYHKRDKRWQYFKNIDGKNHTKTFKNKIDALCYKFYMILKLSHKSLDA
tara:strand:+ start:54 stop:524 length:471 start_codon:yes stop_codon:yes gene_type:complete